MNDIKPILGLEDIFGGRAKAMRKLQFRLFEIYNDAGFSEVIPPIVERPSTLNAGAGSFLSDQTVVFTDPADAGLLAVRPDMTPQIARIVATRMPKADVIKLHYSGSVLLARPDPITGSRQQWQTGVECMGLAGLKGDVEVIHLAALSMAAAGFVSPVLQVGHMGLIKALVAGSDIGLSTWVGLISRHSPEDMASFLHRCDLSEQAKDALMMLTMGKADAAWLQSVKDKINDAFTIAADELLSLAAMIINRLSGEVEIMIDAAVTPRFLYHTGVVFTGFTPGSAAALLHGGRYDQMMAGYGRDIPATGFSFDLWTWLDHQQH